MRTFAFMVLAIILPLSACTSTTVSEKDQQDRPAGQGTVEVRIEGLDSDQGQVYASVYLSSEGFPDVKTQAHEYRSAPAQEGMVVLVFEAVPSGWFAVSVLHDENGDEELSTDLIGIPKEGYGFSLNPEATFGPPPFDEAAVFLEVGESKVLTIDLN